MCIVCRWHHAIILLSSLQDGKYNTISWIGNQYDNIRRNQPSVLLNIYKLDNTIRQLSIICSHSVTTATVQNGIISCNGVTDKDMYVNIKEQLVPSRCDIFISSWFQLFGLLKLGFSINIINIRKYVSIHCIILQSALNSKNHGWTAHTQNGSCELLNSATTTNPYATVTNPYSTVTNPYATVTNPYATATNPYATVTNPYATATNPYATATNPYATAGQSIIW